MTPKTATHGLPYPHIRRNGVRAHTPGPDGRLMPCSVGALRSAQMHPTPLAAHGRGEGKQCKTEKLPIRPGVAVARSPLPPPQARGRGRGRGSLISHRPRATGFGIALIALSFCVAFATTGVPYLMQRHQEAENQAFLTGLARFGPTPTPLAAPAPVVPATAHITDDPDGSNGPDVPVAVRNGVRGVSPETTAVALATQPVRASATVAPSAAHRAPAPLSPLSPMTPLAPGRAAAPHAPRPAPTYLTIPSLGVDTDVMMVNASPTVVDGQAVAIWNVPGDAVGHHANSANPGEGENVVFNGHDDLGSAVFRDLWRVQPGAIIIVRAGDTTWQYHVETVLAPQEIGVPLAQRLANARYIEPTGDERLTLITCWPAGTNDHRIIVIARLG